MLPFQNSLNELFPNRRRPGYAACAALVTVIVIATVSADNGRMPSRTVLENLTSRLAIAAVRNAHVDQYRHCISLQRVNSSTPSRFVLAILAVENYGRPSFQRWEKAVIAQGSLTLLGKLPDFSLGVGQVKPSTARLVLKSSASGNEHQVVPDSALLKMLLDPCENIGIVVRYLTILDGRTGPNEFTRLTADRILSVYNGQSYPSFDGWLYRNVVWRVYETLAPE